MKYIEEWINKYLRHRQQGNYFNVYEVYCWIKSENLDSKVCCQDTIRKYLRKKCKYIGKGQFKKR